MKIFISHQQQDTRLALTLSTCLEIVHGVETALGVIGPERGEAALRLRADLCRCGRLLAVFTPASAATASQRWEIALAAALKLPFATYSEKHLFLPKYEHQSAYLGNSENLDEYMEKLGDLAYRVNGGVIIESR